MQPMKYSATAHHIRKEHIDKDALFVMARLLKAGYLCYLVGGSVRDLLMGQTPKDFDISTSARPEEIKRLFRNCLLIGRRFRLAHVRFGSKVIEVSTFRAGDAEEGNLITRDNQWGSPEEDVLRRDFTINGLFYDPRDDAVIDYVGGYQDLSRRLLRTIGNPDLRFKQDPVRMIRLAKFRARFGFAVDAESMSALSSNRMEIVKSSPARVLEELFKMLESGAAAPFIRLMASSQLLEPLWPVLYRFLQTKEGAVIYRYLEAVDQIVLRSKRNVPDRSILVATLLFPLLEHLVASKAQTKQVDIGDVASATHQLLEELLTSAFSVFPRRLRATLSFILTTQYRLTPPGEKRAQRSRVIHHPEFGYALSFLKLRSIVNAQYAEDWNHWHDMYVATRGPRRRRREQPQEESAPEIMETI